MLPRLLLKEPRLDTEAEAPRTERGGVVNWPDILND